MVRLGQPEATDRLARRHPRKPFTLLFLASKLKDWIHTESALYRCEAPDARVPRFKLLHNQPVGDVVHTGATVFFREIRPQHAEIGEARYQLVWKSSFFKTAGNDRRNVRCDKLSDFRLNEFFFVREQRADSQNIESFKCHCSLPYVCAQDCWSDRLSPPVSISRSPAESLRGLASRLAHAASASQSRKTLRQLAS